VCKFGVSPSSLFSACAFVCKFGVSPSSLFSDCGPRAGQCMQSFEFRHLLFSPLPGQHYINSSSSHSLPIQASLGHLHKLFGLL
jgi:hypothetical protein